MKKLSEDEKTCLCERCHDRRISWHNRTLREDLEVLKGQQEILIDTLTRAQNEGTRLVEENRALRANITKIFNAITDPSLKEHYEPVYRSFFE